MCPGFDEWQLKFESNFVTLKQFTAGTTVVRMKSSNPWHLSTDVNGKLEGSTANSTPELRDLASNYEWTSERDGHVLTPSGTLKSALLIGKKNPVQLGGCMLVVVLKCLCTTWTCTVLVCAMKPKHICNCVSCQLCTDQRSFSSTCLDESSRQRLIYFNSDNPSKWSTTSSAVFKPFGESHVKVHVRLLDMFDSQKTLLYI